jgi:prevent-host-death family protein
VVDRVRQQFYSYAVQQVCTEIDMTVTVKVDDAGTLLAELLARVEAGEEIILSRGGEPVARMTKARGVSAIDDRQDVVTAIKALRVERANRPGATAEEILLWRRDGQK